MEVSTSHSCVVLYSLILEMGNTMRCGEDMLVRDDGASTLMVPIVCIQELVSQS